MGKLDDIRKMREDKYEREQKRVSGVRPEGNGPPPDTVGGSTSRPRIRQACAPVSGIADPGRENVGQKREKGVRGSFDRAVYQREYMRDWRRKRTARLKELEAELKAKEMLE